MFNTKTQHYFTGKFQLEEYRNSRSLICQIIIMFKANDNTTLKIKLQNMVKNESSQFGSKQNTSRPYEDTPASQSGVAPKNTRLELQCRKELNLFFQLKNGQKGRNRLNSVKNCLQYLLSIFKRPKIKANLQNQQYSLSHHFSNIYNESPNWDNYKSIKTAPPLILILTTRLPDLASLPAFNLELLSCRGKNIYSKIEFNNWQTIFPQLITIKAKNERVLYFVKGRMQQAFSIVNQNRELSALLARFVDLQKIQIDELAGCLEEDLNAIVSRSQAELVVRTLKQYQYIKSSFVRMLGWEGRPITRGETHLLIILNNLIANMPVSNNSEELSDRIRLHKRAITKAIKKCIKWDVGVFYGQHFPSSLQNAQACWMCRRRVYTYCPTCSLPERKRKSLCLKCYELHHRTLSQREEGHEAILEEWSGMERRVQAMLWVSSCGQSLAP